VALSPAQSRGGGTFNGGTLTEPLHVAPTADDAAETIQIPEGAVLIGLTVRDTNNELALVVAEGSALLGTTVANPAGFTANSQGAAVWGDAQNEFQAFQAQPGSGDGRPKIGFYGAAPAVRPTGVAVTAAGIHAALVTLGLITA
jgi:hypothetical protein